MSELAAELNRIAGTTNLDAQGAANVWAGTTNRDLVGALNAKAGTTGLELNGVLKLLTGTTKDSNGALIGYVPYTIPDAPTVSTVTAGDNQVSVAFAPPLSDGGNAITGYTATSTPGSVTASGVSSPIVVTGLSANTSYTFTVHATNAAGNSVESAASSAAVTYHVLAADTFNRANGSLNGSTTTTGEKVWVANSDLIIVSNQLSCSVGAVAEILASVNVGQPNQLITLDLVTFGTNGWAGIRARVTDDSNFYLGVVLANGIGQIYRKLGGNFSAALAATAASTFVAGDQLGFSVIGTSLVLYKNSVSVATATNAEIATGNNAGLRHNVPGSVFRVDNFIVYQA